jgi:hypothetical protein
VSAGIADSGVSSPQGITLRGEDFSGKLKNASDGRRRNGTRSRLLLFTLREWHHECAMIDLPRQSPLFPLGVESKLAIAR